MRFLLEVVPISFAVHEHNLGNNSLWQTEFLMSPIYDCNNITNLSSSRDFRMAELCFCLQKEIQFKTRIIVTQPMDFHLLPFPWYACNSTASENSRIALRDTEWK